MAKRIRNSVQPDDERHYDGVLDLLLDILPKRFRKLFSAIFVIMVAVVVVYSNRATISDIWYRFVLRKPIAITLTSSSVYCDQRVTPKDWKDAVNYWESQYLLKVRITTNLSSDIVRLDSMRLTDGIHTLATLRYSGMPDAQAFDLHPRQNYDIDVSTADKLAQDSVAIAALLRGVIMLIAYSDFGTQSFSIDSTSFYGNNSLLLHTLRRE